MIISLISAGIGNAVALKNNFQRFHGILLDHFAEALTECAGGVCLVGIDVHGGGEFFADADHNIIKDKRAGGVDLYLNDLLVGNAECLCIGGGEVDVTLCGDHALGDLYDLYGLDYVIDTVKGITGLTVDYHLSVNVTELYEVVNNMGGFPLYLTKDIYYNGVTATWTTPAAEQANSLPLLYRIGKNTIDCMRSGMIYGTAAMIDGLIDRMEEELGHSSTLVATGGMAQFITPLCKHDIILEIICEFLVMIFYAEIEPHHPC